VCGRKLLERKGFIERDEAREDGEDVEEKMNGSTQGCC
jgi:hypothetical protein